MLRLRHTAKSPLPLKSGKKLGVKDGDKVIFFEEVDTNVLISALLFPGERMDVLFSKIVIEHQLALSSHVIDELLGVTRRKFSNRIDVVDLL